MSDEVEQIRKELQRSFDIAGIEWKLDIASTIESLVRAIIRDEMKPKNCACNWYSPVPPEWKFCPSCGGAPPIN